MGVTRRLIVQGTDIANRRFPFVVRVYASDEIGFCGGVLVTPRHALTAAHCIDDFLVRPDLLQVGVRKTQTLKSSDGALHDVDSVTSHPLYNFSRHNAIVYGNDVAILTLTTPVENATIATLDDGTYWTDEGHPDDDCAYVIGYGSQMLHGPQSLQLQMAHVHLHSRHECVRALHYDLVSSNGCANYRFYDACSGDSGSPLFVMHRGSPVVVGLVSWGFGECGTFPGVYTRLSTSLEFLDTNALDVTVAAPFEAAEEDCSCTVDCRSNGVSVQPSCVRCGEANVSFCYTQGPCHSVHGEHSVAFPGAMWIDCPVVDGPPTPPPPIADTQWVASTFIGAAAALFLGVCLYVSVRMRRPLRPIPSVNINHARSVQGTHQRGS